MVARRGNHEGTITRRKDGRYAAATSLPDGGRRWVYARTRAEAAEKLIAVQADAARGMSAPLGRMTLGGYLERYLEEVAKPKLRPRPYESCVQVVRDHLAPTLGKIPLVKLGPEHVQRYMNSKAGTLSPATVRNHHAILRRALAVAERWGLVHRNVARLVSPPRIIRTEIRPLSPEQARIFLAAIAGDRLEALWHTALSLGLRQGEVLGLGWEHVDLDHALLRVERSLQRYGGAYHLDDVKTPRSRRSLGLPASLVEVLRAHSDRQAFERAQAGDRWLGMDLVFCRADGAPLNGPSVTRRFRDLLERAGLPGQRFHDMRHASASFMLATGVPLRTVMEVLGHSQISITADLYSHVSADATRDATQRVSALLSN